MRGRSELQYNFRGALELDSTITYAHKILDDVISELKSLIFPDFFKGIPLELFVSYTDTDDDGNREIKQISISVIFRDLDMNGNNVWTKQYSGYREIFDYIKEILKKDYEIAEVTEDAFKMKI